MSDLKPGLRWARSKSGSFADIPGEWCIVELKGHIPLMSAEIVYTTRENPPDSDFADITDPNQWQWGPEIEIPDKNWIEVVAAE